jgi:hypothetical protein
MPEARRVRVAAGGEDVAAEAGLERDHGHHDGHDDEKQDRDRDAVPAVKPSGGIDLAARREHALTSRAAGIS